MPGPKDDNFDDAVTTPLDAGERTTPRGSEARTTPYGSEPGTPVPPSSFADSATLRALAQRYDLLNELGRGGMGVVYRARDRETGDTVALKVLQRDIAADAEVVERFKSELLLARKITHPNVCRVHELLRFGETVVISMEYIEGESLRSLLKKVQGFSVPYALKVLRQVIAGLAEAHRQGVVHRDLKPENILIARDSNVKVMDFGIARSIEATTVQSGRVIGTPAYMSPEQAGGKPADARSDIYSLGLVMYELFTGRPTFSAESATALLLKHMKEPPRPPRELDPYLPAFVERTILKSLAKDPKKRFQSIPDVEASLTQQAGPAAASVEAEDAPLPPHLTYWQRSDYGLLALAVVGAVVFFGMFARVFPYVALQVPFGPDQAIANARKVHEKYVPESKDLNYKVILDGSALSAINLVYFSARAAVYGLPSAFSLAREGFGSWSIKIVDEKRPGGYSHIFFDALGRILSIRFHLPLEPVDSNSEPATVEQVLPQATKVAEELFGARLKAQAPVAYVFDTKVRRWAKTDKSRSPLSFVDLGSINTTPVVWILPDDFPDTRREIFVSVYRGRVLSASSRYLRENVVERALINQAFSPRVLEGGWRMLVLSAFFGFLCVCLFIALRLYRQNRTAVWILSTFTALALLSLLTWIQPFSVSGRLWLWVYTPLLFIVLLLLCFAILSVPFHYLSKTLPVQRQTLVELARQGYKAQAAGLCTLRGAFWGLAYLGLHTCLLWFLGLASLAGPSPDVAVFTGGNSDSLVVISGAFLAAVLTTWIFVALPLAVTRRATRRVPALFLVVTLLFLLAPSPLFGATAFPALPQHLFAGIHGLMLAALFLRYDLLTCMFTALTIETWLLAYPMFRLFEKVEPWAFGFALVPWFLLVLLGTLIFFRPQLTAGMRRVVALFE